MFLTIASSQVFDRLCHASLGASLSTTSSVILVGAVLSTSRQVQALLDGPRLQGRLEQERAVIHSLSFI